MNNQPNNNQAVTDPTFDPARNAAKGVIRCRVLLTGTYNDHSLWKVAYAAQDHAIQFSSMTTIKGDEAYDSKVEALSKTHAILDVLNDDGGGRGVVFMPKDAFIRAADLQEFTEMLRVIIHAYSDISQH